jgi:branched-chain amino acid transport system substrate-binding protein
MTAAVAAVLACCLLGGAAQAQNKAVKIGVLDDMSGVYAENTGPGDVAAVKFAIADFGGSVLGKPIEMVTADFQNKVDVGVGIAKRWYDDEGVSMIIGIRGEKPHPDADRSGNLGPHRQGLRAD